MHLVLIRHRGGGGNERINRRSTASVGRVRNNASSKAVRVAAPQVFLRRTCKAKLGVQGPIPGQRPKLTSAIYKLHYLGIETTYVPHHADFTTIEEAGRPSQSLHIAAQTFKDQCMMPINS